MNQDHPELKFWDTGRGGCPRHLPPPPPLPTVPASASVSIPHLITCKSGACEYERRRRAPFSRASESSLGPHRRRNGRGRSMPAGATCGPVRVLSESFMRRARSAPGPRSGAMSAWPPGREGNRQAGGAADAALSLSRARHELCRVADRPGRPPARRPELSDPSRRPLRCGLTRAHAGACEPPPSASPSAELCGVGIRPSRYPSESVSVRVGIRPSRYPSESVSISIRVALRPAPQLRERAAARPAQGSRPACPSTPCARPALLPPAQAAGPAPQPAVCARSGRIAGPGRTGGRVGPDRRAGPGRAGSDRWPGLAGPVAGPGRIAGPGRTRGRVGRRSGSGEGVAGGGRGARLAGRRRSGGGPPPR
jgi:hypothetical protein